MQIDVATFVSLTAALAGCARPPPAPSARTPLTAEREATAKPEPPESTPIESAVPDATSTPSADESSPISADLTACDQLSPACEGLSQECRGLGGPDDGFLPRVAEEIAACWKSSLRPPGCRGPAMKRCIRDAVTRVSVDPATASTCDGLISQCQSKGKRASYTRDQCQQVLSSVSGRTRDDATRMMGPMAEGCTLRYVLPYYPFGATR